MRYDVIDIIRPGSPEYTQTNGSSVLLTSVSVPYIRAVLGIQVQFTVSQVTTNRIIQITLLNTDETVVYSRVTSGAGVGAVGTTRHFTFAPGVADLALIRATQFTSCPLPSDFMYPPYGAVIRIRDINAIDPVGDLMLVTARVAY